MRSAPNDKLVAAQKALGNTVDTSAALLDVLGELMVAPLDGDGLTLYVDTMRGLHTLATQESVNLRARFDEFISAGKTKGGAK